MGGTLAAIANILAITVTDNPLDMGFWYFLIAEVMIVLALIGYLCMPLMVSWAHFVQGILTCKSKVAFFFSSDQRFEPKTLTFFDAIMRALKNYIIYEYYITDKIENSHINAKCST